MGHVHEFGVCLVCNHIYAIFLPAMQDHPSDAVFDLEPFTFLYAVGYRYEHGLGPHVVPLARLQALLTRPAGLREGGLLVTVPPAENLGPGRLPIPISVPASIPLGRYGYHGEHRLTLLPVDRAHLPGPLELRDLRGRIILLQG